MSSAGSFLVFSPGLAAHTTAQLSATAGGPAAAAAALPDGVLLAELARRGLLEAAACSADVATVVDVVGQLAWVQVPTGCPTKMGLL